MAAPLPAHLTEASTHLAKQAEEIEHAGLLTAAAAAPRGSVHRGALLAAWCLAWHGNGGRRTAKPANPGPGETLEVVADGGRVKGLYEAVFLSLSARRYEAAWHVTGPGWTVDGQDSPVARVAGAALEIAARVRERVTFDDGETFTITRPEARLLVASRAPYFTLTGVGSAVSEELAFRVDTYAQPSLLAPSVSPSDRNRVDAPITALDGSILPGAPRIVGSPLGGLDLVWGDGSGRAPTRVWTPSPLPKGARGGATAFVAGLCEYVPALHASLPPTDSRWRPDIAALADGRWSDAATLRARARSPPLTTRCAASMRGPRPARRPPGLCGAATVGGWRGSGRGATIGGRAVRASGKSDNTKEKMFRFFCVRFLLLLLCVYVTSSRE